MTTYIFVTILLCGLVTWLTRVVPFAIIKNLTIPAGVIRFLSFVPVAIMTAIFIENLLIYHAGHWPSLNLANSLAALPAILAGILTKNLLAVVVTGVLAMAALRFIGFS
ncbi:branched-chain amino acid ABC transporter [Lactobacillus sp. CBA3605]|uniref:AzlD domain-containing protein n=1 Tax=Lactobacillus sp. CBA3605 TaxID=2099788 RepID=UPI000CFB3FBD|nr:AzlD domain-containing protein [Lactobacillus sp. CBA3605]AVK62104.1 branched-chain amino acid ABC transporter [Lactobacillus sp. CBA3605]